jgi:hypothetical protein
MASPVERQAFGSSFRNVVFSICRNPDDAKSRSLLVMKGKVIPVFKLYDMKTYERGVVQLYAVLPLPVNRGKWSGSIWTFYPREGKP